MGMPGVADIQTVDELLALPDDGLRHELLDGVHVVTPSPSYTHQEVLARLFVALDAALRGRTDLRVLSSPADLVFGPRTLLQPDLFVFRVDPDRPPREWHDVDTPVIAIEIVSPTSAARDRGTKRRIYQRLGMSEYWIVDPDARLIERWTPADERPEILTDRLDWAFEGSHLLTLDITALLGG